ncbi:hypothetical protein PSQ39_18425 [Curvibacter sp. HBC28]|uniref:50S ribosomal protein L11 methyltransferase n=1 Tax=Curvibacter microcysteis TaxID=3026419 RepID=A0ABT5MJM9_9BURK|nr:hypothetical protein [Curvibacter sp. HBC28]MDD0816621.1 hypothetical protein [Curvibacter sp. HBC28]
MSLSLDYLDFELSEDIDETQTLDAMASVWPEQWAAMERELRQVMQWARQHFGAEGALDEGALWDVDVQAWVESEPVRTLHWDAAALSLTEALPAEPRQRCTLTVSICGGAVFAAAFRQQFNLLD